MAELLTHLSNSDDSGFENCRRAVTLLWHHCKGENVELVRTLAEPELQMAKGFYEVEPDSYLKTYGGFMEICKEVAVSDEDSELGHIRERLEGVARGVERAERQSIQDILMYVVKGTDPNAQSWQIFANDSEKRDMLLDFLDTPEALGVISRSNIVKAMKVAGEEDSSQEVENKAEFLSEKFPVSLELYRQLIKKLVINEVDMTKSKHKKQYMGYANIVFRRGTRYCGWEEASTYYFRWRN